MNGRCYKRYSVYHRDNEMPLIIFATASECAAALGCDVRTFYAYLSRFNAGKPYPKNYLIYEDELDEDEKEELREQPKLSKIEYEIILALAPGGVKYKAIAKSLGIDWTNIYYHLDKIQQVTGLDPENKNDLKKLVQLARERGAEDG